MADTKKELYKGENKKGESRGNSGRNGKAYANYRKAEGRK